MDFFATSEESYISDNNMRKALDKNRLGKILHLKKNSVKTFSYT